MADTSSAETPDSLKMQSANVEEDTVPLGVPELDPAPLTIDQLIRTRAAISGNENIVAYPVRGIDYVDYTTRDLDGYAYNAAKHYATALPKRQSSAEKPAVIGILGPSNLDYLITMLALTKLGHTVLYLSPRISEEAHRSLLESTGAKDLIVNRNFKDLGAALRSSMSGLRVQEFAGEDIWRRVLPDGTDTRMDHHLDAQQENKYVAWIIHSSGSTSLPKPVFMYHYAVLNNYRVNNVPLNSYITMPLYHSHGISNLFKCFYSGKQVHLYNADLPLATRYLVGTLKAHHFDLFQAVPYVLKLLVEDDEAIELLAKCRMVVYGGSPCPDSLGDFLTERGVFLVGHYGTTETGHLMTSERPASDKTWNWMRPSEKIRPHLRFEDQGAGLYEVVCLAGWPGKVMTNREDGSYATRDLFTKHPHIEAYKYYSRLDDTITLVNGEKANPLLIEGLVRRHAEVKEAVAFGAGRARIGLLLFPSDAGALLDRDALLDSIWPSIERAQLQMPDYSHLSQDMVKILSKEDDYPKTDKGTIIRQAIYRKYEQEIDSVYHEVDNTEGDLKICGTELRNFILEQVQRLLGAKSVSNDGDFFALGMDSLKATQLRSIILSRIDLNGGRLGLNVAFDFPSAAALATHLEAVRSGRKDADDTALGEMESLIDRFGHFQLPQGAHDILLTGATGAIGAHIASLLARNDQVSQVYCLVRASSPEQAKQRVMKSLEERRILSSLGPQQISKLVTLPSDLSKPCLGLEERVLQEITERVTSVIHCAWSVNFNLRLSSFVGDCVSGVRHLIDLCIRSQRRASFNFCSSVSTVANSRETEVSETVPNSLDFAQGIGYSQSKLVAERICTNAAAQTGITARVLRIGQICGDTEHGIWNPSEAFPLIFQTALTTGVLPQLDENPRWLPLDVVAATVVDLSLPSSAPAGVYNVINPRTFHWSKDLLPLLHAAGLKFTEASATDWVRAVQQSDPDQRRNPPYKLVEYFVKRYDTSNAKKPPANWATAAAHKYSASFRACAVLDQEQVNKMVQYWTEQCWTVPKGQ